MRRARYLRSSLEAAREMWYVKNLVDRAQVAILLWRLRRQRSALTIERP